MADYSYGVERVDKLVYTLPNPTNWIEYEKARGSMIVELQRHGISVDYDDTIKIEADDEEIRLVAILGAKNLTAENYLSDV